MSIDKSTLAADAETNSNDPNDDEEGSEIIISPAPDAECCGRIGCTADDHLKWVKDPRRRTRVLCQRHRRDFLGVKLV